MPMNSCVYAIIVTAVVLERCHQKKKGNGTVNVANNMRITNQYLKKKKCSSH